MAYGGAIYALPAARFELRDVPEDLARLIEAGRAVNGALANTVVARHPGVGHLRASAAHGSARSSAHQGHRNVANFADGEVDRSPTGSATSGAHGAVSRHEGFGQSAALMRTLGFMDEEIIVEIYDSWSTSSTTVSSYPVERVALWWSSH